LCEKQQLHLASLAISCSGVDPVGISVSMFIFIVAYNKKYININQFLKLIEHIYSYKFILILLLNISIYSLGILSKDTSDKLK